MRLDTGMDFGPWLARQLKQSGMSQADLAQRIGLTRAAVSAWITGRATPREETINRIAEALGTDLGTIHTRTADTLAGLPISWYHRPGHADGGREFGNAAAFAFEADVGVLAREATQNSLDERLDLAQPVRVRYTLHELSGEALARFRDEIRWDDLLPHYEAAAQQDQKVGRMIAAGLSDMYERDRLVLLRIDDYNASGLTGDDYETGRFAAVVRRQLDSQKSVNAAGGSYGLGKATLWATSRLGLVLMNSTLSEPHEGRTERRLIGRLDLPWRRVGGRAWAGPAWFGRPDPDAEDLHVARSWWADEESVERLHLTRESAEPGTSFLIVGAHDVASLVEGTDSNEDVEDDDSVHRMHYRLLEALGRNFWAAMTGGGGQRPLLEASVRTFRNGVEILSETRVDPRVTQPSRTRALQAFLDGTTVEKMTESGQVAMATVPLVVPGRSGRGSGGEHRAVVLVTEAEDGDDGKSNRVTTMRGNRMTVKVGWVPGLPVGTNPFQAVLLAGRAAGDDAPFADEAEAFLRAAEPPEHDKWGQTEELRMLYSPSAYRRIGALTSETNKAVRALVALPRKNRKGGPERLRKRLSVGGRRTARPTPASSPPALAELDARIDGGGAWCVTAEVRIPAGGDSWRAAPVAKLDVRSGPRPVLAWSELVAVHNCEIVDGVIRFAPGSRTATFRGTTDVSTHPVRALFSGLVLDLRTDKGAQA
ncbi:Helix-turn-helix protein [Streptomyces sp. ADI96-02]|uniref:helix-turn-helix domain-containing protein n=1 Tax=Streptomyces sp. ADI96-02 TaxID=1522760 RepID=UPI000F98B782|nr:helix-turn-helix transcriptional regulator [Streptomyces sp. ADI96-02]RPK64348.1 Helix-turn-helix protein [Streptomyces sp. ADI96-02]